MSKLRFGHPGSSRSKLKARAILQQVTLCALQALMKRCPCTDPKLRLVLALAYFQRDGHLRNLLETPLNNDLDSDILYQELRYRPCAYPSISNSNSKSTQEKESVTQTNSDNPPASTTDLNSEPGSEISNVSAADEVLTNTEMTEPEVPNQENESHGTFIQLTKT